MQFSSSFPVRKFSRAALYSSVFMLVAMTSAEAQQNSDADAATSIFGTFSNAVAGQGDPNPTSLFNAATGMASGNEAGTAGAAGAEDFETRMIKGSVGVASKVIDAADDSFGPADEFFLGKEIAARMIGSDGLLPDDHPRAQLVQKVGRTLAAGSNAPRLYSPWIFMVSGSREINAWAAPGGLIVVTTGMMEFLENEDELAFILGHELGHVEMQHNIEDIGDNKMMTAGSEAAGLAVEYATQDLGQGAAGQLANKVGDIAVGAVVNSMKNGYSVEKEGASDKRAVSLMQAAGYSPLAALDVLQRFRTYTGGYGGDGYPEERANDLSSFLQAQGWSLAPVAEVRTERYQNAMQHQPVIDNSVSSSASTWNGGAQQGQFSGYRSGNPFSRDAYRKEYDLATLYFPHGSAALGPDSQFVLTEISRIWQRRGGLVLIQGHASKSGFQGGETATELGNFRMSEKRIDRVRRELQALGVPAQSIRYGFYADNRPAVAESGHEGESWDRRVRVALYR